MPCKDTCLLVSQKREREPEEETKLASPENKSEKEEVEINPLYPYQKKKRVLVERNDAVNQEVIELINAIILKEVYSPRWVANPVMWTQEAELAFQELKRHLQSLPALTVLTPGETLILYLAVSHETISSVLMTKRENVQKPIYFVSKALQGLEVNFPLLEKLAITLVHTARRLRRYFQAHTICVLINQPIRKVLLKPENSGRLAKWAIELGEHDIRYKPRSAIKGQVFADFIAESSIKMRSKISEEATTSPTQIPEKTLLWTLFIDGASSNEGFGASLILTNLDGEEITYALRFEFPASNNEAEYEALIAGLELAIKMEVRHLQVFSNSLLVTNHVKGSYEACKESMKRYLTKVLHLQENFESFSITQVPHLRNRRADALSKLASSSFTHLTKKVLVEVILCQSTEAATINVINESKEVNFGLCEAHVGARTIAQKAVWLGYYWLTMYQDVTHIVSTCRNCQEHTLILQKPQYNMTSIYSLWPFYQWRIDIVGPFPEAPRKVKFLVIVIDYFIKWVEAAPLATITGKNTLNFVWINIVCHFGISGIIVSDNGKQFSENPFRDWCSELNIKQQFTSVAHPQANG
ncbi:reverse transcriptase domain-containing protein [Tanacetum coccineum]